MLSKALSHFPQFRFRDREKRLYNPILKTTFSNLPEERVRLALVDYLTVEANVSSSRISFESPVKLAGDKSSSRTDIICYDADFKPRLLVECKAPEIKLDEKAAVQIARYNQKVGAPFLLVSNGVLDFWFEIEDDQVQYKEKLPNQFQPGNTQQKEVSYWVQRGFIGEELPPKGRRFAVQACKEFFGNPHHPIKYLNFDEFAPEFALGNYYRIFGRKKKVKVALSFSANPFGGTRLNAILNKEGENVAFCSVSLDLVTKGESPNGEVHSAKGVTEINFPTLLNDYLEGEYTGLVDEFHDFLNQYS